MFIKILTIILLFFAFTVRNSAAISLPAIKIKYAKPAPDIRKIKKIPYALQKKISLKGRLSLGSIFYMLSLDTHINFNYSKNINTHRKMTLVFNNEPLYKILSIILHNYVYHYSKHLKKITVHAYTNKTYRFSITALTNKVDFSVGSISTSTASGNSQTASSTNSVSSETPSSANSLIGSQTSTNPAGMMSDTMRTSSKSFYNVLTANLKNIFKNSKKSYYNIIPNYGLLTVHATKKRIRQVGLLVKQLKKLSTKKIVLTVKILEIQLNNQYQFGINMNELFKNVMRSNTLGISNINFSLNSGAQSGLNNSGDYLSFTGSNSNQAVINALQTYGKVKLVNAAVLSVLNGQTRVISSGSVIPYESGVQVESLGLSNSTLSYPQISEAQTGLSISFTPLVKNNKVYATIAVVDNNIDGYSSFSSNGNNFSVPNINTKTMIDTFAVKSDTSVLLGGLTTDSATTDKYGVPILDDIPVIGYLFSGINNTKTKKEIYILLKPKIIK
jgi:type II secretory pathway component GspD/PulD (secretin)